MPDLCWELFRSRLGRDPVARRWQRGRYARHGRCVQRVITAQRVQSLFSLGTAGLLHSLLCDSANTGAPRANRCEFVAVKICSFQLVRFFVPAPNAGPWKMHVRHVRQN